LTIIEDDLFVRLTTFPNVLVTGHQGFLTRGALAEIAEVTLANISGFQSAKAKPENVVGAFRSM